MNKAASSYDEVPYDSMPRSGTHPDSLAVLALLLGMRPAPPDRCRVLELGCASGGNLLPLAEALPDSRFVGIDLSARQIETGRAVAGALGLDNLRLDARSILDVDEGFGTFDYIVCHGVYSWVPAAVRDKVLAVCRNHLAPHGVAYVSYNTYPGWHLRAPVREMMAYHVRDLADPAQRVARARGLLEFLVKAAPNPDSAWARTLREEADLIRPEGDFYVFHEHLEEENHPVYFHEFIRHARAHGLQYLGEVQPHTLLTSLPDDVQETLSDYSGDLLELEQYTDFVKNRTFRRTLLVADDVRLNRSPGPAVTAGLCASGLARPVSASPDVRSRAVEEFVTDAEMTLSTNSPIAKAALVVLHECWPRALPLDELWQAVLGRTDPPADPAADEQGRALLARSLVQMYLAGLAGLHAHVPAFVTTVSDRPRTTPLTRLQARSGAAVSNRRHRVIKVGGADRVVLQLLDGTRDRAALVAAVVEKVRAGEVEMHRGGERLTDPEGINAAVAEEVDACLGRLAHLAVLVG
jgi:methyltransferase-like protein/SAM-dependent methyltransferase